MNTQIIDDLSVIRVISGTQTLLVNKKLIKTIEITDNETVRIDIGEGVLRHIYLRLSEVSMPFGLADVAALAEAVKQMLETGSNVDETMLEHQLEGIALLTDLKAGQLEANSLALSVRDDAALSRQLLADLKLGQALQNGLLTGMKDDLSSEQTALVSVNNSLVNILGALNAQNTNAMSEPLRVDESEPATIYYGYAAPDAREGDPVWAIKRARREGDLINYDWAEGDRNFTHIWANRNALSYGQ